MKIMNEESNVSMKKVRPPIWKHLPQLSVDERDRRWELIRKKMRTDNIDCLLIFGDEFVRYLTHVPTNTICAIFPLEGDPIVYYSMRAFDFYWNFNIGQKWVRDCRPLSHTNQMEDLKRLFIKNEREWKRIGVAIPNFTRPLWSNQFKLEREALIKALKVRDVLPGAEWVDTSHFLLNAMMICSPEEIALLEKAARIAEFMFDAMCEKAGTKGARECEIYSAMLQASINNGGELDQIMLDSGSPPLMHPKGTAQFCVTTRELEYGDMVTTEYHATYSGYKIAKEHTISIGKPEKRFQDIFDVCVECHTSGFKKMRPGIAVKEAADAFLAPAEEAGLAYVENGFCLHGIYSCVHPKTVATTEYLEKAYRPPPPSGVKFQEGMVFGTIVDLYDPSWQESTMMLGDTVLITENGPRRLTKIPMQLVTV